MEVMSWLDAAAAVFLGGACVGCGRPGRAWCPGCAQEFADMVGAVPLGGQPPGWTCLPYSGCVPDAVVGFKDRGVRALRDDLGLALAAGLLAAVDTCGPAHVVPAPCSPAALRRRGFDHMWELAQVAAVAAGLPCRRLLRTRRRGDSVGLDFAARRRKAHHSMSARRPGRGPVIVVDDVRTSGATLAESARALSVGGYTVLGTVVVAASI